MELDTKDVLLLNALQQNGSQRLEDLAKAVHLAASSVHDRLRRLQHNGVIQGWTVKVDSNAVGLGVLAYIHIAASSPCRVILPEIEKISAVEECHSVAGRWCMLLKVRVPDTAGLLGLIDRLREISGVEETETTIVLQTRFDRPVAAKLPAEKKLESRRVPVSV